VRRFAVLSGGGTAGHVLPALAIAEALADRGHPRSSLELVGSRRGIEPTLLDGSGFVVTLLPGRGLVRGAIAPNVAAGAGLAAAAARAVALLGHERPRVVVSVGGYAAFPCALAAVLWRIPLVQTTIDAVPGAVNRLFGRFARANAVAMEGTKAPRAVVTGAPVRSTVIRERDRDPLEARREIGLPEGVKVVLAFGGSLGARRINEAVVGLARRWRGRGDVALYHVVGRRDWETMSLAVPPGGTLRYQAVEYEDRLARAIVAADVVVCRAGAMSVAELTVLGAAAVLVPLPGAPDDHQAANAAVLAAAGAAVVLEDGECREEKLAELLDELLAAPERLASMRQASRKVGRPDAAERIATLVELHAAAADPADP
jgi:UDP-N-acetylglucosamine--N-acetylmuramyl-(pentapeptide) pyrophosphoryl-undecaprenol N-acetylglucosamine transferase